MLEKEKELAKAKGIICPEAGLPDIPAIKKAFGFGPEDITDEFIPHSYTIKLRPQRTAKEHDVDSVGWHVRYGADTEI